MEEVPIPARSIENDLVQLFQAQYAAPAYVRRARRVEDALNEVLERGRRQRRDWLEMVKLRLGTLVALAVHGFHDVLDEAAIRIVQDMHAELDPRLRVVPSAATSPRAIRRALAELNESIARFNERWQGYLAKVDLRAVNEERADYNRYYLLEKECALRSARLARVGFRTLEPLTVDDLLERLPLLPTVSAS
ncbi:MAG: hypothetical protein AB7K24_12870 [Gemmataceae bacterium]